MDAETHKRFTAISEKIEKDLPLTREERVFYASIITGRKGEFAEAVVDGQFDDVITD